MKRIFLALALMVSLSGTGQDMGWAHQYKCFEMGGFPYLFSDQCVEVHKNIDIRLYSLKGRHVSFKCGSRVKDFALIEEAAGEAVVSYKATSEGKEYNIKFLYDKGDLIGVGISDGNFRILFVITYLNLV